MQWSAVFFLNSILLGIGLAMDACSVSVANGLNEPRMTKRKQLAIAGTFGFFQTLMPLTGWICVRTVVQAFQTLERYIPWIGFLLLLYLGGKMVHEGITQRDTPQEETRLETGSLLLQGVATSIDALSVGFTIEEYGFAMALACALIIGAVTFCICVGGLLIGRKIGTRITGKANIVGGLILIAIGIRILVEKVL